MGPSGHNDRTRDVRYRASDAACLAEHPVFIFESGNGRPFQRVHPFSDLHALGIEFYIECPRIRRESAEFLKLFLIMRDRHVISSLAHSGDDGSREDILFIFYIEYLGILGEFTPEMLLAGPGHENELAGRLGGP